MTTTAPTTSLLQRPAGLHLIDAENLVGDPFAGPSDVLGALRSYCDIAGYEDDDLVFLAANRWLVQDIVFDLPFTSRARTATGPDGADLALLGDAPVEWVCSGRFDHLVIGSGDHIFGDLAEAAIGAGVEVAVIGRRGSIASRYVHLGCDVRTIDDPFAATAAIAA